MSVYLFHHCRRVARLLSCTAIAVCVGAVVFIPRAAHAESELQIDSASINAIKRSLADRLQLLRPHFESGVVGLTQDGMLSSRKTAEWEALSLEQRRVIETLIVDDNKDRNTLVREIARANGRPDWEAGLKTTFAERWIQRAPPGWYIRQSNGQWVRKDARP